MKKIIPALLCACLCLTLCACGSSKSAADFTTGDADTLINTDGLFSEQLEKVDADVLCQLYGIDQTTVSDCKGYLSTGATAEEVAVFIVKDKSGVQAVKDACDKRIADQKEACKDYLPAEEPKLDSAVVETRGNTVLLAVAAGDGLKDAVSALGGK